MKIMYRTNMFSFIQYLFIILSIINIVSGNNERDLQIVGSKDKYYNFGDEVKIEYDNCTEKEGKLFSANRQPISDVKIKCISNYYGKFEIPETIDQKIDNSNYEFYVLWHVDYDTYKVRLFINGVTKKEKGKEKEKDNITGIDSEPKSKIPTTTIGATPTVRLENNVDNPNDSITKTGNNGNSVILEKETGKKEKTVSSNENEKSIDNYGGNTIIKDDKTETDKNNDVVNKNDSVSDNKIPTNNKLDNVDNNKKNSEDKEKGNKKNSEGSSNSLKMVMFATVFMAIGGVMVYTVRTIIGNSEKKYEQARKLQLANTNPINEIKFPPLRINPLDSESFLNMNESTLDDILVESRMSTSMYVPSEESVVPVDQSFVTSPAKALGKQNEKTKSIMSI